MTTKRWEHKKKKRKKKSEEPNKLSESAQNRNKQHNKTFQELKKKTYI